MKHNNETPAMATNGQTHNEKFQEELKDIINETDGDKDEKASEDARHYVLYAKGYYQNFGNSIDDLKLIYAKLNNIHFQKVRRVDVLRKLQEIVYKYDKEKFFKRVQSVDVAFALRQHSKEDILDIFIQQWLCALRGMRSYIKQGFEGEPDENIAPVTKGEKFDGVKYQFFKDKCGEYDFDDSSDGFGTIIDKHL
jgi:hypothetical protein